MSHDEEQVRLVMPHWYAMRAWAESVLCSTLGLKEVKDLFLSPGKGDTHPIPGSTFSYSAHGVGVNVDRGVDGGGIDFDFDQKIPDAHRLHRFCIKQLNAGNLPITYRELLDDYDRFVSAARAVLGTEVA